MLYYVLLTHFYFFAIILYIDVEVKRHFAPWHQRIAKHIVPPGIQKTKVFDIMKTKVSNRKFIPFVYTAAFFLFAVLFTLQSPESPLAKGTTGIDSSVFQYIAYGISRGITPYIHVFDHKGPLIYFIDYIGQSIHFSHGIWLLEILFLSIAMFISYKTILLFSDSSEAFLTTLVCYLMLTNFYEQGNLTEEWALPFIAFGLHAFVRFFIKETVEFGHILLCGLSFGAICLLRINMAGVWISGCLAVFIYLIHQKQLKKTLHILFPFLLGIIIICLPFLIYLAIHNAIPSFLQDYFLFNFEYKNSNLPEKYNALVFFCKDRGLITSFCCFIFLFIRRCKSNRSNKYITYMTGAAFVLSFCLFCMAGRNYAHYAMVLIPLYTIPVGCVISEIKSCIRSHTQDLAAIFILCVMLVFCILPLTRDCLDNFFVQYLIADESDNHIAGLIAKETLPEDTIAVYGNHCSYYYLSQRLSATTFAYTSIFEEHPDYIADYIDQLEEALPKLIIIEKERGNYSIPEELQTYIDENQYFVYYEDSENIIFER